MASNLSSIGFVFPTADFGRRMLGELAGFASRRTATLPGDYAVWRSGSGAELWFHVEGDRSFFGRMDGGHVVGLRPFFAGEGRIGVRVEQLLQGSEHNVFEGVFAGVTEAGDPIAFEAVDFALHELRERPIHAQVQLVGFARELTVVGGEAGAGAGACTDAAAVGETARARVFLGDSRIGFGVADNDNAPDAGVGGVAGAAFLPRTHAILRGVVVKSQRLENEVTERGYHWLLVEGPGGSFDIVADLDIVTQPIEAGAAVEVFAEFSGRLLD